MRAPVIAALAWALVACGGGGEGADAAGGGGGQGGSASAGAGGAAGAECATSDNDAIRLALEPACRACHDQGSNRPFFASLSAFESLLAYNPAYVVRGSPGQSRLVALLSGTASGTFSQMPLGSEPYLKLPDGQRRLSLARIEAWITDLAPPPAGSAAASPRAVTTRRLRVGELTWALQDTLGYAASGPAHASGAQPKTLWLHDPDGVGGPNGNNAQAIRTWVALGGGSSLGRVPGADGWSGGSLQVLSAVSLEWCGEAVKRGDAAIFRHAQPADTLATGRDKIRKNIGYLHLRLLGDVAPDADLDAYVDDLFALAEPRGPGVAWTEVCAALVRDPRFLSF